MGSHKRYKGISLNVFDSPIDQFANALKGHDVVIWYNSLPLPLSWIPQPSFQKRLLMGSTFGPHTGHVVTYVPFVEGMRKIVLAVKAAVIPYFIMIGGTGSTILESEGINCCDSRNFWVKVSKLPSLLICPLGLFLLFTSCPQFFYLCGRMEISNLICSTSI